MTLCFIFRHTLLLLSSAKYHYVLSFFLCFLSQQGGRIIYDPECGFSKGCFVDCKGKECNYMVTWRDVDTAVQFELYGKPDPANTGAWLAVAFSADPRMVICSALFSCFLSCFFTIVQVVYFVIVGYKVGYGFHIANVLTHCQWYILPHT